jgi:hypothetical protein
VYFFLSIYSMRAWPLIAIVSVLFVLGSAWPATIKAEDVDGARALTTQNSVDPAVVFLVILGGSDDLASDSDADGVLDELDQCPNTSPGSEVDTNGCAPSQLDSDSDGVTNDLDQCPQTALGVEVDSAGCAQSQLDDDSDGVSNDIDQCPATDAGASVDANGCAPTQLDDDNDGVNNADDQCPNSSPDAVVDDVGCEDRSVEVRAVYESDVNPLIVSSAGGCTSSGCHGRANAPGGLRLYPSSDSNNVQRNYDALVSYIDRRAGNALLGKISGMSGHGGGVRYLTSSSEYQIIADWVRSVEALP